MRLINLETWSRRDHFKTFSNWDHPHFNMCANVDLTAFVPFIKAQNLSFSTATLYVITRTANAIPEFRYRIRPDTVVAHEMVHPGTTILAREDLFTFCVFEYTEDFATFASMAKEKIAYMKDHPTVENESRDDVIYTTAIPWITFTSFMHPLHLQPPDSVPRFAWGKFTQEGESLKMPLSVQGHHALMDGFHIGQFYAYVQGCFDHPGDVLGFQ